MNLAPHAACDALFVRAPRRQEGQHDPSVPTRHARPRGLTAVDQVTVAAHMNPPCRGGGSRQILQQREERFAGFFLARYVAGPVRCRVQSAGHGSFHVPAGCQSQHLLTRQPVVRTDLQMQVDVHLIRPRRRPVRRQRLDRSPNLPDATRATGLRRRPLHDTPRPFATNPPRVRQPPRGRRADLDAGELLPATRQQLQSPTRASIAAVPRREWPLVGRAVQASVRDQSRKRGRPAGATNRDVRRTARVAPSGRRSSTKKEPRE